MKALATVLFFPMVFAARADFVVKFRTGDVKASRQNRTEKLRVGDRLRPSATIITGSDGRVSLADLSSGNTIFIIAGKTIPLSSVSSSAIHDPGLLRQEIARRQANTMAAVRADSMGKPDNALGWDEGGQTVDHSAHWSLLREGKFEQVKSSTASAKDPEGKFLHAQSTFLLSGSNEGKKIESLMQAVLASNLSIPIKSEASKTLALLSFEQAEYDQAFAHARRATKSRAAADIDAALYYVLVMSARMNGEDIAADAALAEMRKYHPNSVLLKKLDPQ